MTADPRPARDREATERRILDAARQVLAEAGSEGFGVNAVARAASCDKQLIYRYFGGLNSLLDAIGQDIARWWADRLQPDASLAPPASYAELMERLALPLLQALRDDPLMRKIALWEITSGSEQVQRLAAARSRAMFVWMQRSRGTLAPPEGIDAPAVNAILVAAVLHLVLASGTAGSFSGLPLKAEADWDRLRDMLCRIIATMYR
jgi:AcrR family transcriptional regulator